MSLREQTAQGVKWTSTSTVVTILLNFIQMAVLAHLLNPSDFGLMSMVLIVVWFGQIFSDMGISNAIIYHQDTTDKQLSSLYWFNVLAGLIVFLFVLTLGPLIVSIYHEPRIESLTSLSAVIFLVTPLGQQFQVLFQKALRFKLLAGIQMAEHFIRGVVSICLAFWGFGATSLVIGYLAGTVVRVMLLFLISWRKWLPKLHFSIKDLNGYFSFGLYQMGDKTANFLNSYVIQLLIGSLLGAKALGYYVLAFDLVLRPTLVINPILTRVAFPVFSMIQKDSLRVKRGYLKMLRILSLVNFPIVLGIGVTAPIAVPLIYGNQWIPSVILVQILSVVAILRSTGNPVGSLLLSHGRADLSFKWNLGKMFFQIPFVYAGATYGGVAGAVIAYLFLQSLYFLLNYFLLVTAVLNSHFKEYIQSIWSPLWISLVMVAVVFVLGRIFPKSFSQSVSLASEIVCGAAIYIIIVFQFEKQFVLEIKDMVWSKA